ncbi:MAG TPA: DUF1223 domain-containing protein [Acidobacteriaceae bacterium]|nr:DUF1223 domain-containing protein [Acidobacteriaceae bacterium]
MSQRNASKYLKKAVGSLMAFAILSAGCLSAADAPSGKIPIVVELFTSQGCSSCPPADEWLAKIDQAQPVPGAELIVMSEHVDYWDHDGWRDPYSSASLTARQAAYVAALHTGGPYTPDVILDGATDVPLSRPQAMAAAFRASSETTPGATVQVERAGDSHLHVKVTPIIARLNADVFVAEALDQAKTNVGAGENKGRALSDVAVVQSLAKLGTVESGQTMNRSVELKPIRGESAAHLRIIVFVQERDMGRIVGAAMLKPIS